MTNKVWFLSSFSSFEPSSTNTGLVWACNWTETLKHDTINLRHIPKTVCQACHFTDAWNKKFAVTLITNYTEQIMNEPLVPVQYIAKQPDAALIVENSGLKMKEIFRIYSTY